MTHPSDCTQGNPSEAIRDSFGPIYVRGADLSKVPWSQIGGTLWVGFPWPDAMAGI